MRSLSALILLLLAVALPSVQLASAQDGRVGALIRLHEMQKARICHASLLQLSDSREDLYSAQLDGSHPNSESCAVYVQKRMTPDQLREWSSWGIALDDDLFIPPLPGKHPHGFHVAVIPYELIEKVAATDGVIRLRTLELPMEPHNDVGRTAVNLDPVQAGVFGVPSLGSGISLAIADTGMNVGHPDLPTPIEAYDVTDGPNPASWGSGIGNFAVGHGTHVVGTAVGSGVSSNGLYKGAAPQADLYFYKIGNDYNGFSTEANMVKAVNRAATVGADIFNMSFGGWTIYLDGSSAICQAVDAATAAGTTCVISAGNSADDSVHDSVSVAPGTNQSTITYTIDNSASAAPYVINQWLQVIWKDDNPLDQNVLVSCTNLAPTEFLFPWNTGSSPRGTEMKGMMFWVDVPAGQVKTYNIKVWNVAASGVTPDVQFYRWQGKGTFNNPDNSHTVHAPALADTAISVGAWTHRPTWTDASGVLQVDPTLTYGTVAPFSSQGPRIDGVQKPDIVAPGAATISTREALLHTDPTRIIANGTGPGADYYIDRGTSMAAPLVAGGLALMLEAVPTLTPDQLRLGLTLTSSQSQTPDNEWGYGVPDFLAMVQGFNLVPSLTSMQPGSCDAGNPEQEITLTGTGFTPNSVVEWNGAALTTNFVDSNTIKALLTANELITGASFSVSVRNTVTGALSPSQLIFIVNAVALGPSASGVSVLSALGSTGGADRRVDVDLGQPFDIALSAPPASSGTFWLFGRWGIPQVGEVFAFPGVLGDMAFQPCPLVAGTGTHFTVASSSPINLNCPAIVNGVFAPWQVGVPGLLSPLRISLQGVVDDAGSFAFTNGILINVR